MDFLSIRHNKLPKLLLQQAGSAGHAKAYPLARRYVVRRKSFIYRALPILTVTAFLYGCSDTAPIQLTEEQSQYIGVWQLRIEEESENSLKIDNMLLRINSDSTAVYRKCEVNKTQSGSSSRSSISSISFSDAVVTKISDTSITVTQKVGWFGFDAELNINRAPYQENQRWFVVIAGKKLTKLSGSGIQAMTNWECPSADDED